MYSGMQGDAAGKLPGMYHLHCFRPESIVPVCIWTYLLDTLSVQQNRFWSARRSGAKA